MKRPFSIFDALFLVALIFKIRGFEPVLTWFEVFAPYVFEAFTVLIAALFKMYGVNDRAKFWLWKLALSVRTDKAARKAKQFMKAQEEAGKAQARSGNPGKFVDPKNLGK